MSDFMNRFSHFSVQERMIIQESLINFSNKVIEDDDFFMDGYDEDELDEIKSDRDNMIEEINQA